MKKETKELVITIAITSAVVITAGTVMAFLLSGIPVLQIIAALISITVLIYGIIFYNHDCDGDDFRG